MKIIINCIATIILALILSFSIHTFNNTDLVLASSCDTECLGSGTCEDNPEGGIICVEKTKPDGFPYCENSPCTDPGQN